MATADAQIMARDASSTDARLMSLFDFEGGHERIEARMRSAIDRNGLYKADLRLGRRLSSVQIVVIEIEAVIGWEWKTRNILGKHFGVEHVREVHFDSFMNERCKDAASSQEIINLLSAILTSDVIKVTKLPKKMTLGPVSNCVACEVNCHQCSGTGKLRCNVCYAGWERCRACGGQGWVMTDLNSRRATCYPCKGRGEVHCSSCGGSAKTGCQGCLSTGVVTQIGEGSIYATVRSTFRAERGFGQSRADDLTKRGLAWLAGAAAVDSPTVDIRDGSASAAWRLRVPVLSREFAIAGQEYSATWVGTSEAVWHMPPILDASMKDVALAIAAANPVEAFETASGYPLTQAIRRNVLEGANSTDTAGLRDKFERMASEKFLSSIHVRLAEKRDQIAAAAVASVWKFAMPSSVVAATAVMGMHPSERMPQAYSFGPTGMEDFVIGLAGLACALAASHRIAAKVGRDAVRRAIGAGVAGWPRQGRASRYAVVASLALYGGIAYAMAPAPVPRPSMDRTIPKLTSFPVMRSGTAAAATAGRTAAAESGPSSMRLRR